MIFLYFTSMAFNQTPNLHTISNILILLLIDFMHVRIIILNLNLNLNYKSNYSLGIDLHIS